MKLSFFLILFVSFLLLSSASKSAEPSASQEAQKLRTDKNQQTSKEKTTDAQKKSDRVPDAEKSLVETLRKIADQQKAANEQNEASQKSLDSPAIRLSIYMAFIGTLYTLFAAWQWRAIRRQVNLERPWMMFRPENPNSGSVPPGQQVPVNTWPLPVMYQGLFNVRWNVINVGRSPAFLTRLVAKIELVETGKFPPALPSGTSFPNYIISPKTPPDDRFGTNLPRYLTKTESIDIQNGSARIWVYGVAEYRGIRKRSHTTRFCCVWYVENGNSVYDPVGPDGWTKYT